MTIFDSAKAAARQATSRGSKVEVRCAAPGCRTLFMARKADRARGWGRFCSKTCKAAEQEGRTGQFAHYMDGQRSEEGSNRWTDDDGNVYARRWDRFGQKSMVSCKDAMTGEVSIETFDKHGMSEGFLMSPSDLAGGGYGDADWDTPFGDGK